MGETRGVSRRAFLGGATAAAAVAATGGGALTWFVVGGDDGPGTPQAFAVSHDDDVRVTMTDGEQFTVRVVSVDGTELERFEGVTAGTLLSLESEHVSFTRGEIPTAA